MTFDPSKPYAATHGRPVRILASDVNWDWPIVAAHKNSYGREHVYMHGSDGKCAAPNIEHDLHNVPERVVREFHVSLGPSIDVPYLDVGTEPANVRFTFEGDKLVVVELIGETQ